MWQGGTTKSRMIQSRGSCEYSFGSQGEGSLGNTWIVKIVFKNWVDQTKFDKFISLTMTHIKLTDNQFGYKPKIETNIPSWNKQHNHTFITAELRPIHTGRLMPPGTPVGIERGLSNRETTRFCLLTMRWGRARPEAGAGLVHCPKTTLSSLGWGLHQNIYLSKVIKNYFLGTYSCLNEIVSCTIFSLSIM